ncbi:phytase [bacterium]|nr:phytase [bacterium]
MKKYLSFLYLLLTVALFVRCGGAAQPQGAGAQAAAADSSAATARKVLAESWISPCTPGDNIDSPALWRAPDGADWVICTAKSTDELVVYNGADGRELRRVGAPGEAPGRMRRPNGVAVIDDLCVVVERDNHRVQVFGLPAFNPLGTFGAAELIKPYGLYVLPAASGGYRLYVTDNYETAEGNTPPDSALGARVKLFSLRVESGAVKANLEKFFGETNGLGVLHVVESICADPSSGVLLVADEDAIYNDIKVYDLEGNFSGRVIGHGLFRYQPEGIALYESPDGGGYWVMTDQDMQNNTFHVFGRKDFKFLGSFGGEVTANTDGIAVTSRAFGPFAAGALIAVHNDCGCAAFDWNEIVKALGLGMQSQGN